MIETLETLKQQLAELDQKRSVLAKQIEQIELSRREKAVGLMRGDALIVTQEFVDYLSQDNGNPWPFELGGRATVGYVHEFGDAFIINVVNGDSTGGIGGDTHEVDMIKRMRIAAINADL